MIRISTHARLSWGLVLLTISILFAAHIIGLIPDKTTMIIAERRITSESLAVLSSKIAEKNDIATLTSTLQSLVERNTDIFSAALRKSNGELLAVAGEHDSHWKSSVFEKSNPTHIRVPIYQGKQIWGHIEVAFAPIYGSGWKRYVFNPNVLLITFVILTGFAIYRFFLGRVLKHLDPTSVVPPRVRAALDTMVEGIVLLDNHARIVLANDAFSKKIAKGQKDLTGKKINDLDWEFATLKQDISFPWMRTLQNNDRQLGIPLYMPDEEGRYHTFIVNTSPIIDDLGKSRGVLATFDDVTQVEEKNEQLKAMVKKLELYSEKIKDQNKTLEYLATRDSLTGCYNRRSFFDIFDKEFLSAKRYSHQVSCIMFDIDHFKSINDTHGHASGDDVLRNICAIIVSLARQVDTVGRYGGEEFCVILPHIDLDNAAMAAERFRAAVQNHSFSGIRVTASFGVSSIDYGAADPAELIDQADQALYAAKTGGRNRVVVWKTIAGRRDRQLTKAPTPQAGSDALKRSEASRKTASAPSPRPQTPKPDDAVANPSLPQTPASRDEKIEALRLVLQNLSTAGKTSGGLDLSVPALNGSQPAVQLDGYGAWGEEEDMSAEEVPPTPIYRQSVRQAAKLLQP